MLFIVGHESRTASAVVLMMVGAIVHILALFVLAALLSGCSDDQHHAVDIPASPAPSDWSAGAGAPGLTEIASTSGATPCPVTIPNGSTPPREQPSPDYHGNGGLWTALWPEGTVVFVPGGPGEIRPDGSLGMKWPWWLESTAAGTPLTIEGRRLDAPAPPLRAEIHSAYEGSMFQASGLSFPSEGCWEVTGTAGGASLTFVTFVMKSAVP
jgi:hypothetical protein